MHFCTQQNDVNLDRQFQKHMSKENRKHQFIDQGKYIKTASKRKCTDREYHVQDSSDVSHKDVKIYCDTNQFPTLIFCGSHSKSHGSRGLGKHYNLCFDPNIGHGICAINHISCACVACK